MNAPVIVSDSAVMLGKPLFAGTRVTVELVLEKLAAGEPPEQIERAHPHLPPGAVRAALACIVEPGASATGLNPLRRSPRR